MTMNNNNTKIEEELACRFKIDKRNQALETLKNVLF